MTTVVAVARDGRVWMAADSLTNVYERPILDGARKVRRLKVGTEGKALLGVTGAGGLADLMGFRLQLDDAPDDCDNLDRWAADAAWAATQLAAEVGLVDAGRLDGSLLLGYRGRLWTLSETHAIPHPDGIAALGSGEGPAIGALHVLLEEGFDPAVAVMRAALIGVHYDRNSHEPVHAEFLPPPGSGWGAS